MNRSQAQDLIASILELGHEGELQIQINGIEQVATRFNDNAVSQNALKMQTMVTLSGRLEQKKASVSLNGYADKDKLKQAIDRVFATCRYMPDDEEVMPAMGRVVETREHAFSARSDAIEIETIGAWAAAACKEGNAAGIDLAGLLALDRRFSAYGDSAGGFAHERFHRIDYHVSATGNNGSGWAEDQGMTLQQEDVMAATRRAIDKCGKAQKPKPFKPRPSTVILEPKAVGELIAMAFWYGFDQRTKDEGRSAFSNFTGNLGNLSLYSDPANAVFPTISFTSDGQALHNNIWLDEGKLQQLVTPRYWAAKNKLEVKSAPNNLVLSGQGSSIEELIKGTEDAILVTRFWYIRSTDAKTLGFTGMTRDGTFRIENGEITHPVVEMRWNESVLHVLRNVTGSGKPVATYDGMPMAMPALKVEDFHFSSLSN